jgi:hypothetical protein
MSFCSNVNCISFLEKEFSLITHVTHDKMFVWLSCRSYIYVFFSFLHHRRIKSREQTRLIIQLGINNQKWFHSVINNRKWFHSVILDSAIILERSEDFTPRTEVEILASSNLMVFSLSVLKATTKNFHLGNLIGEGGFNYVYKGWIDGQTLVPSYQDIWYGCCYQEAKTRSFPGP